MSTRAVQETVASEHVRAAVRKLVAAQGVAAVARYLHVSREAVARVAAGIPVRAGTLALVLQHLAGGDA